MTHVDAWLPRNTSRYDAAMTAVTIKDVAARAGVSPKTVSRVMNGEAHVRTAVREAVMRVVEELGYRPNAFARGLSSSRSFLIGMFFENPSCAYAADLQRGALRRCREFSHHLVVEELDPRRPDWRERLTDTLREVRLGGAILVPPICDHAGVVELLHQHDVPVVRIAPGAADGGTPRVRMDDRGAAREMTGLLLSLGHRDIAFIRGPAGHSATMQRWCGFQDAMAAAGQAIDPRRVLEGDFTFRSGLDAAETLLGTPDLPSAVFASNDEMALATIVEAMRRGIAVPERLSVVGFDDAEIARMAWPQLTTIRQPNADMAAAAIDLLIAPAWQARRGEDGLCVELPYVLVRRPSVAAVA